MSSGPQYEAARGFISQLTLGTTGLPYDTRGLFYRSFGHAFIRCNGAHPLYGAVPDRSPFAGNKQTSISYLKTHSPQLDVSPSAVTKHTSLRAAVALPEMDKRPCVTLYELWAYVATAGVGIARVCSMRSDFSRR